MRIDLIINRTARMIEREPALLDRMASLARPRCTVAATACLGELDQVVAAIAARGTDLVLFSGGDGTLMAGVSALAAAFGARELPPISPIPGGTAGTVARNWGILGRPENCLARILSRPRRHALRPTLAVSADGQRRVGFIFGTGLVAKFFALYYQRGAPGYSGSALLVARIFAESFAGGPMAKSVLDPLPCRLEVDGIVARPEAWSLVCASVVPNLGIHMLVNYRAGRDPRRPHLVATSMPPRRLGPRAPVVLAGLPLVEREEGDIDALVGSFAVSFAPRGPYVLDGELCAARRIEVTAGPELTVALPA